MNANAIEPEQAALAAERKTIAEGVAKKRYPTDEAKAARYAAQLEKMGGQNPEPECTSNYGGTGCYRPVCKCYPNRGYARGREPEMHR